MQPFAIAPSILSADFARLGEEVDKVLAAGADIVHFDVIDNHYVPNLTIGPMVCAALRKYGITAPIDAHVMDKLDMILLMSVNPGFGGQKFIPHTLEKLKQARALIDASGREIRLEIDGGVNVQNIREIAAAGADTFVAGSAIFNQPDYKAVIDAMRAELAQARG